VKTTPQQSRAVRPLIDSNPRALEYHAARITRAPVAAAVVPAYVALALVMFACAWVREYGETFAEVMNPPGRRVK